MARLEIRPGLLIQSADLSYSPKPKLLRHNGEWVARCHVSTPSPWSRAAFDHVRRLEKLDRDRSL